MVVLGVAPGHIETDPVTLTMGRRRLLGSPAGSRKELRETLNFAAEHGIRPRVEAFPLERAADAFQAVNSSQPAHRVVLVPSD
jgi:D-arabinose 1-dehydrogenase-like Zn-dependent alcohol dehydrogenase